MGDESLNVKLVPEIDEESINEISEQLSGLVASVTGTVAGSAGKADESSDEAQKDLKETESEAIKEGVEKVSKDPQTLARITDPLVQNQLNAMRLTAEVDASTKDGTEKTKEGNTVMGRLNEGLAVGVGMAINGWGIVKKLFNIIASSAGPLKDVLDMFNTIFGLFLLPLNIALTQILIPYVQKLAGSMSEWVKEMLTVYKEGGLGGLIVATFGKLVDVFVPMLIKMVEYTGTVVLTVLRQIWNSGNLAKAVITMAVTIPTFLIAFKVWSAALSIIQMKQETLLLGILAKFFEGNILAFTRTATLASIAVPVLAIAAAIVAIVAILNAISGGGVVSGIQSFFGFAEGGVFEPNSEKIIKVGDNLSEQEILAPKSTIVSAVSEALTENSITNTSNTGRSIVLNNTFNINGSNPQEIATEVEKQLSRMMDNASTKWGY